MNTSFEEIGYLSATFPAGTAVVGKVCKLSSTGAANTCAAGDRFCGIVTTVRGGYAGVQVHGFVTVSYSGTAPALGYSALSANGNGGIKADATGHTYLVVKVDTVNHTAVIDL